MKRKHKFFSLLSLLILWLLAVAAKASTTNSDPMPNNPIHIESDKVTFYPEEDKIIYQGHVVVLSGKNQLYADEVVVTKGTDQAIQSISASGKPAHFITNDQDPAYPIQAFANQVDYKPQQSLLILTGNAKLTRNQDAFEGPILKYTLNQQKIEATTLNQQRPRMVITPKQRS